MLPPKNTNTHRRRSLVGMRIIVEKMRANAAGFVTGEDTSIRGGRERTRTQEWGDRRGTHRHGRGADGRIRGRRAGVAALRGGRQRPEPPPSSTGTGGRGAAAAAGRGAGPGELVGPSGGRGSLLLALAPPPSPAPSAAPRWERSGITEPLILRALHLRARSRA